MEKFLKTAKEENEKKDSFNNDLINLLKSIDSSLKVIADSNERITYQIEKE